MQWDPERDPRLQVLPYRSIQIGISGALSGSWSSEWIVGIEDVTEKARALKKALDEDSTLSLERLIDLGLMPVERTYPVSEELRKILKMNLDNR